jgi:L-ascorbate metabolism protein UlaG (beta-lactamase superfamily)
VASVTYVGHSTVLVSLDGTRLLTDPLLRRRVAHLRRRAGFGRDEIGEVDAVLVSHAHYDHLDVPSLLALGRSTRVVVPRGIGKVLRNRGFTDVTEVTVGEQLRIGDVSVEATYADHDGARAPLLARGDALGFVLAGSRRIYFAGDTDLFEGMRELGEGLDLALVPIWGWGPSLGSGHLDADGAARAVALLQPRIVVPIHWGTFHPIHLGLRTAPTFLQLPPRRFVEATQREAPDVEVRVLQPGETLEL